MTGKKVLVVGAGGREHALAWKLASSPRVARVFVAPGNAGIAQDAVCVPIKAEDLDGLASFAKMERIDLTVVGPEVPLALGIVDRFHAEDLPVFGPQKAAAEIEASKVFAKDLMARADVPTGAYRTFTDPDLAMTYIREEAGVPIVLKADGLAAGKGVIVARTLAEADEAVGLILRKRAFGSAGDRMVVEEFLTGEEVSFMAVTDGKSVLPLATSQDHKAVYEGDKGPNTGGMGAYSPAPLVNGVLSAEIQERIMAATVRAMAAEGRPYLGVLYGGLMIDGGRPRVLEFNCRFGDPEAQPILLRLKTDLMEIFDAVLDGRLDRLKLEWDPRPAVCVVLASGGYPGKYETDKVIRGLDEVARMEGVKVFHAGTALKEGRYVTVGGRVLGVTAIGETISKAMELAYRAAARISWEGMHYRRDVGKKALRHECSVSGRALGTTPSETPQVGIVMGSLSDREVMKETRKVLDKFGVRCEFRVASAHRTPELAISYAREAEARGIRVLIAGAGMAAHLAGALAANTTLPVIGVPIDSSSLKGLDALLSTVQMPPGVPVATMAIGRPGAKNAGMFALQILALGDRDLADRLREFRAAEAKNIEAANLDL